MGQTGHAKFYYNILLYHKAKNAVTSVQARAVHAVVQCE